jgi:hypothetical protein
MVDPRRVFSALTLTLCLTGCMQGLEQIARLSTTPLPIVISPRPEAALSPSPEPTVTPHNPCGDPRPPLSCRQHSIIDGTVVDTAGNPLDGAAITAVLPKNRLFANGSDTATATSANGAFTIGDIPGSMADIRLTARKTGYIDHATKVSLPETTMSSGVTLTMQPAAASPSPYHNRAPLRIVTRQSRKAKGSWSSTCTRPP